MTTTTGSTRTSNEKDKDVSHVNPYDNHHSHIWFLEPEVSRGVLTQDGVTQIAHHKYVPGTYTTLDTLLNPMWQYFTDCLPLWLAPNAVTALGGLFCLFSYFMTARYNFTLEQEVPSWILVLNGVCLMVYYTLDCMDGKQARRTQSSSPLGQLFDHGVDCVANLSHIGLMQCILNLPARGFWWLQICTQLGFFQAQWEEYYTGSLTHAAGDFGTTEVLYSMASWSLLTGLGILDRTVYDQELPGQDYLSQLPGLSFILGSEIDKLQVRHGAILFWVYGLLVLSTLSTLRVIQYVQSPKVLASAMSKLISPVLISALALTTTPLSPLLGGIRYPSLCVGLVFCIMTIKVIVLSMARMAYATFQFDIVPLILVLALHQHTHSQSLSLLIPLACIGYLIRLAWWTHAATGQLCQRLNVQLFRIKPKIG